MYLLLVSSRILRFGPPFSVMYPPRCRLLLLAISGVSNRILILIGILPANTRYRLVGNANPHLVENVGQVEGAGQLLIRNGSRAEVFKLHMSGAGQT